MEKSKSGDWQRIEAIMAYYQFPSVSAFARHLGLNRSENLYQIKRKNNGISRKLAETINRSFPSVSIAWLVFGEGEMFVSTKSYSIFE